MSSLGPGFSSSGHWDSSMDPPESLRDLNQGSFVSSSKELAKRICILFLLATTTYLYNKNWSRQGFFVGLCF